MQQSKTQLPCLVNDHYDTLLLELFSEKNETVHVKPLSPGSGTWHVLHQCHLGPIIEMTNFNTYFKVQDVTPKPLSFRENPGPIH